MNVQTLGRLSTPEQFAKIVLRANPDGSVLRLGDVAHVEMGAQNQDTEARVNGRDAAKADDVELSRDQWYRILLAARGKALP